MEPERWRQIEDLFQAALDCEPERRSAFLEMACGRDTGLREEVDSLLASYEKAGFTEAPAFHDALRLLERDHSLTGKRIGPYRLIREIGRGGMGAVYLAARADEAFRKQVAIKLIKRGLDTESILQRFRIATEVQPPTVGKSRSLVRSRFRHSYWRRVTAVPERRSARNPAQVRDADYAVECREKRHFGTVLRIRLPKGWARPPASRSLAETRS